MLQSKFRCPVSRRARCSACLLGTTGALRSRPGAICRQRLRQEATQPAREGQRYPGRQGRHHRLQHAIAARPSRRSGTCSLWQGLADRGESATTLTTAVNLKIGDLSVPAGTYTDLFPALRDHLEADHQQTDQAVGHGIQPGPGPRPHRHAEGDDAPSAPVEKFAIKFEKTTGKTTQLHLIWENTDVFVPVTAQ